MSDKLLELIQGYNTNPIGFPEEFIDIFNGLEVFKKVNDLGANPTEEQKLIAYNSMINDFMKISSFVSEINNKEVQRYAKIKKSNLNRPYTVREFGDLIDVMFDGLISCRSQVEFMKIYFQSVLPVLFTLINNKLDKPQPAGA